MINFIQCNQGEKGKSMNIINKDIWEDFNVKIKNLSKISSRKQNGRYDAIICHTINLTNVYNLTIKNLFKDYLTYVIRDKQINVTSEFLKFVERLLHTTSGVDDKLYANYTFSNLEKFSYLL